MIGGYVEPAARTALLDHGYVAFVEAWGSDERIVESARMSTDKGFKGWGPTQCRCYGRMTQSLKAMEAGSFLYDPGCTMCKGTGAAPGDEKFLRFLWENKHHSPFEQAGMTIEVQAPIFVFREWHRHRTQSYNELSARYTALPDLYYVPSVERIMAGKQAAKNKQGSADGFSVGEARCFQDDLAHAYTEARKTYEFLLAHGVARELARLVIPVAQYSRMRASANLRNWLAFLTLRMDPGAQWETRQYANVVGEIVARTFPRVWDIFKDQAA